MPKVRVSYAGWIALPEAVRQKLGLSTGNRLDLELSGETVTLRRSAAVPVSRASAPSAAPTDDAPPREPSPAAAPEPTTKRGPGRPRKVPGSAVPPPTLEGRGAKRKAGPADEAPGSA